MKVYVGNLSYEATEQDLRQEFGAFGKVGSVDIITDRFSGRPRGFGFIEMATKSEGESAISGLNGKIMKERTIVVNEARPPTDNRGGGSYGDRSGSSYGGGGGGSGGSEGRQIEKILNSLSFISA
jgi:RNA recognition motif-containing protein